MSLPDPVKRLVGGCESYAGRTPKSKRETLAKGQSPAVLWIGCSDSRVPETTICDREPGDIFVHRNIANIIHANDASSQAVVDFAVGTLKVKQIIICGHTNCGGAAASLDDADLGGNLNGWLKPLRELRKRNQAELDQISSNDDKIIRLAELNVKNGIDILLKNSTIAQAIESRGLDVRGAIYDIAAGELRML